MKRAAIVMETEEAFCPSAEEIERWMDSAFDMVGWSDRTDHSNQSHVVYPLSKHLVIVITYKVPDNGPHTLCGICVR